MIITTTVLGLLFSLIFVKFFLVNLKSIRALKQEIKGIKGEFEEYLSKHNLLVNADLGFAKQLAEINRMLISMDNQLQSLENKRDNDGGYQHALRILEMGGDKDEIVNSCHLSNAEAELLINLNAYRAVMKDHPKMATE